MVNVLITFLIYYLFPSSTLSSDYFNENLFISSLNNGDIITIFNFTFSSFQQKDEADSIYIPWLFFHLFGQFSLDYFKLSIAQGFWRTNLWGYQHINTEVPSGTELSVKFSNTDNTVQKWHDFVHLINGLFCSSILGLLPQFSVQSKSDNGWWYGALGGESVCTENLQSWKKLLPCKKYGLVSLLKPTFLLSARFHSIYVELNKQSIRGHNGFFKLNLISKTVYNYESFHKQDFVRKSLFSSKLHKCSVSTQSRLLIEKNMFFDLDLPDSIGYQESMDNLLIIDLHNYSSIDLSKFRFKFSDFDTRLYVPPLAILMHSFLKSISQVGGIISININNPFPYSFNARFTQILPWQIRTFLHTLHFVCTNSSKEFIPFSGEYILSRDGIKPLFIELSILLPATSKCNLEFEFESAFLKISEFPPDANSGILVPGAVLLISKEASTNFSIFSSFFDRRSTQKIFGEPLLILLPVPDFSMPFNVICFVCTTIAIFYGNVFALSTKLMKLFPKEKVYLKEKEQKTRTIKERILGLFNLFTN